MDLHTIIQNYERPKTEQELYKFLYLISRENIPHRSVCKDHNSVWDFVTAVYFNKHKNILAIGNRKGGKTRSVAKLIVAELFFNPFIEIASVGAIEKQANKCFRYVNQFLHYSMPALLEKDTRSETRLSNGASYEQLVGTVSGVNCLAGDTKIQTIVGEFPIKELVGKNPKVLSFSLDNYELVYTEARDVRLTGKEVPVYDLALRRGKKRIHITATARHPFLLAGKMKYRELKNLSLGDYLFSPEGDIEIERITFKGYEDVYDMTVDETNNFVANSIVVHNSPHPHKLRADEVELMKREILEELLLVPTSDKLRGIPANTLLTSTRKYHSGLVQSIIESSDKDFKTFIWCYKEVSENCPLERRGSGKKSYVIKDYLNMDTGGKPAETEIIAYSNCGSCPLLPSCRGELAKANGYVLIDDLISDYKKVDPQTWIYQMECRRTAGTYKVYPQFDEATHIIPDLKYNPNLPLDLSIDFGYADPSAVLFLQYDEDRDIVYVIDEIYKGGLTTEQLNYKIREKLAEFKVSQTDLRYQIGDSAQAQLIADLNYSYGYNFEPIAKTLITSGLDKVRNYLLSLDYGIRIYFSGRVINTIKELKNYHFKKLATGMSENPVDKENHCCDALRYYITFIDKQKLPELKILG